jgi:hypothetical protein
LWIAPNAIEDLLYRLYRKVASQPITPMAAEIVPSLKALKAPLAAESGAEAGMSSSQQHSFRTT